MGGLHHPLATVVPPHALRFTLHAPRQTSGVRSCARPSPRWLLPATDHLIDKERTGPDLGKRSRYLSMRRTERFPRTKSSTSRQRAKSTAGTERIGHGGATHQTANLCNKLNCASSPRPQGRAGARLFQQPDLENHWVPMRNRALPSVMAFVAQATHPAGALLRDRQPAA